MSHFKAKMHRIRFLASVRLFVCSSVRSDGRTDRLSVRPSASLMEFATNAADGGASLVGRAVRVSSQSSANTDGRQLRHAPGRLVAIRPRLRVQRNRSEPRRLVDVVHSQRPASASGTTRQVTHHRHRRRQQYAFRLIGHLYENQPYYCYY